MSTGTGFEDLQPFARRLQFDAFSLSTGVQMKFILRALDIAGGHQAQFNYRSGAILAISSVTGNFVNYSAGIPSHTPAVAVLLDPRLPASDNLGNLLPPETGTIKDVRAYAVVDGFDFLEEGLFASKNDLSDVAEGMASMGAKFNEGTQSYSKF